MLKPSDSPEAAPQSKRRRRLWLFMAGWTLFVILAVWWLIHLAVGPGVPRSWIIQPEDALRQSWSQRARDWLRLVHFNFQRIYPWILLAPYAAWAGARFTLERGQLRRHVPLHLGACALFILAAHTINQLSANRIARVVIITSQTNLDLQPGQGTNKIHVEISRTAADEFGREAFTGWTSQGQPRSPAPPDFLYLHQGSAGAPSLGDLEQGFKGPHFAPELPSLRPLSILLDLFAYAAIVGLAHSVHFYRRYREREHRALFLESTLTKARLNALQTQLHPHFLFNSLNAIATLLRRDPRLAETTLMSLSDLLRLTLSQSEKQEVTLREELLFAQNYLEIQQTRFGDRLRFEQQIEPAALNCLVPTLLLQPLIENAIRHGIEPAEHAGLVRLVASETGQRLLLAVEDDGVGLKDKHAPSSQAPGTLARPATRESAGAALDHQSQVMAPLPKSGTGIGLANLRARLEALYGTHQKLELSQREGGGVSVRIEIPWRTAPAEGIPALDTLP